MKKLFLIVMTFVTVLQVTAQNIGIIPMPQQIESEESHFLWDNGIVLTYDFSDEEIAKIAELMKSDFRALNGKEITTAERTKKTSLSSTYA
jgi:hypothetical protein